MDALKLTAIKSLMVDDCVDLTDEDTAAQVIALIKAILATKDGGQS